MARDLGLGVTPWSPLAGGLLTGKYSEEDLELQEEPGPGEIVRDRKQMVRSRLTARKLAIAGVVSEVAEEAGTSSAQVAIRWVLDRPGVTSPILGARTTKQLDDNLGSLDFELDPEHTARLDEVSQIELGFPHDMITHPRIRHMLHGGAEVEPYSP